MASFNAGANAFLNSPNAVKTIGPNPTTARGQGLHVNVHPTLPLLIYPSGRLIVVKNYVNPSETFVYRGHTQATTVAKFSPNGFWVASADISGKVRVWSWDNPEHLTKIEVPVFSGTVYDLDWDFESKKIVAVGDGSGILVKCFQWDTGSMAGEMMGHNKRVISVAYKPTRPFRVMSGSEDMRALFFAGPPFKLDHSNSTHTNFVNCVRYSSNGNKVVSVGTDKKIQVYDGATGQPTGEVPNAHDGGIYSVSFSPDGSRFATASADKTVKIWNSESLALEQNIAISAAPQLGDAQVSVIWTKDKLISVSLNGDINLLGSDGVESVIQGHQVAITTMALDGETLYSGSYDGVVCSRPLSDTFAAKKIAATDKKNISGAAHGGKLVGMAVLGDSIVSVGWDDKLRIADRATNAYHTEVALNGQPQSLAAPFSATADSLYVVVTNQEIALFRGADRVSAQAVSSLSYTPTCAAILGVEELAVGGSDNKTHIYNIAGGSFTEVKFIETRSAISALAYSHSGAFLAIGDSGRQVEVYERGSWGARVKNLWVFHTSKVTALAWSPDDAYLASGSLDENIFIWCLAETSKKHQFQFSHLGGVTGFGWWGNDKLVSVGNDHTTVTWNIPPLA